MIPEQLNVACCVDRGFAVPVAVALASLDHAHPETPVTVHVVHSGLSDAEQRRITSGLSTDVVWHGVDESTVREAHHSSFLTPASLYRLLLGEILPENLERVLYLDADTLVVDSLCELFRTGLGESVVGAVRDAASPWAAGPLGPPWQKLGMQPGSPYFNSGVMLIDLPLWRDREIGQRCLGILRGIQPRWGDQDGLNAVLEGAWHELPRRWNLQTPDALGEGTAWAVWPDDVQRAVTHPALIHYSGRDKPWTAGTVHPLARRWFDALDTTAWSGWRPTAERRSRTDRAAHRLLQFARARRHRRRSSLPS